MSGINYDLKRIKGMAFDIDGVLSPTTVSLADNGLPRRMVNLKDEFALQVAVNAGIKIIIISGARKSGIEKRLMDLGISDVVMGASDKLLILQQWMARENLDPNEMTYCGDDVPDFWAMKSVGLRVAPNDACRDIKCVANYISQFNGGDGVVRDLIEQTLRAQYKWPIGVEQQSF